MEGLEDWDTVRLVCCLPDVESIDIAAGLNVLCIGVSEHSKELCSGISASVEEANSDVVDKVDSISEL